MNKMTWSFCEIWNKSLEEGHNYPVKQRDRIWATELGGAMIDRFLKMKGVEPTNPPNPRSRRKFEAGNIWEAIVGYVLKRAGILIDTQDWVSYQYPELLQVTGKLDFLAGGNPDYEKALNIIHTEFDWLPEFISRATEKIILKLKEDFPDGLKKIILEIKSCSSFMFELYEKGTANPNHKLQLFHYLKAKNMPEGHIVYVCKDDARIIEIGVFNPSSVEDTYKKDIQTMTQYYKTDTRPPLEKPIIFDNDFGRFSVNYKVGYSNYLTLLYGFKSQKEVDDKYKPVVERWNRVLGRIKEGKDMTENNKKAIQEMSEEFDFEAIKRIIEKPKQKEVENETT